MKIMSNLVQEYTPCRYFEPSCFLNCILKAKAFLCYAKAEGSFRGRDHSKVYINKLGGKNVKKS